MGTGRSVSQAEGPASAKGSGWWQHVLHVRDTACRETCVPSKAAEEVGGDKARRQQGQILWGWAGLSKGLTSLGTKYLPLGSVLFS